MPDSDIAPRDRMPQWVWKAVIIFWTAWLVAMRVDSTVDRLYGIITLLLVSIFLALAIEPGVNRLSKRGWRRGPATALFLVGALLGFVLFVVAIAALVGQQIADLLQNSEDYVTRFVRFV